MESCKRVEWENTLSFEVAEYLEGGLVRLTQGAESPLKPAIKMIKLMIFIGVDLQKCLKN
jgi:hypothetical protein